jgi:hypothetical protein
MGDSRLGSRLASLLAAHPGFSDLHVRDGAPLRVRRGGR